MVPDTRCNEKRSCFGMPRLSPFEKGERLLLDFRCFWLEARRHGASCWVEQEIGFRYSEDRQAETPGLGLE